jgi:predicted CXXCH cytochrome family protein
MIIHPQIYCLTALLVLACLTAGGCGLKLGGDVRPLVVVVSGDTSGWIAPCGCTTNQSGGLPRRASFVEQISWKAKVVAVDVGGSPHGTSAYDLAKFEAILAGEMIMGIEAHNIGAAEARLGPDVLRRLSAKQNIPFISANVRDAADQLLAEPLRIVNVSGWRLALVGVLSEKYATEMIHISPPRQTILEIIQKTSGSYDSLIVLAYLPEEELQELAESIPEADVIVGGPTGQPIAPKQVGPVLLTSATNKGKFLARLEAPPLNSTNRWTASIVELNDRYADNPRQTANIEKFRQELARRDFTPGQTSLVEQFPANMPKNYAIAGNSACQKCHQDDCYLWRKSKHSLAWNTLKSKGASYDPDCQRCHTTGYGLPGGFSSVACNGGKVDVGCESCHGPSKSHVINPNVLTPYYSQAKDRCIQCHDRENSPQFNYDKYWNKIDHGESLDVLGMYIMENEEEDLQ